MSGELELRLYRDSLSTPWGFRLHGGKDLSAPLSIHKVSPGTPADGELQNGDVLLQIQGGDAARLTHLQAQEQIRKAGGSLLLRILRYGTPIRTPIVLGLTRVPEQKASQWNQPASKDIGHDYARHQGKAPLPLATQPPSQPGFMLSRVKDTLNAVAPGGYGGDSYYHSYETDATPTRFHLPPAYPPPTYAPPPAAWEPEQPAWTGSLRSSGRTLDSDKYIGPHPHSPKVQTVHYGPGASPQYKTRSAEESHDSATAYAAHLQYNSPLGLYSRKSAQEALHTQVHGKPGEGTLQILPESEVHRSIVQADDQNGRLRPQDLENQTRQSPSHLLESQFAGDGNIGQSDF